MGTQLPRDVHTNLLTLLLMCFSFEVAKVQAQCSKPAGGSNMVLKESSIMQDSFPEGSKAVFECTPGYSGSGSRAITCEGGTWSKLKLMCEKRSCGSPGEVNNGRYETPEGIEFGARVTATCNTGYTLVGSGDRICQAEGWTGRTALCQVVRCAPPPEVIPNGRLESPLEEEYDYSSSVSYVCERGFTLDGEASITCAADGTFRPSPPTCIDVTCPTPKVPNGYRFEGGSPPYKLNSFIVFKCNPGYKMEGEAGLTCRRNSSWSLIPKCIAIPTPSTTTTPTATSPTDKRPGSDPTPPPDPGSSLGTKIGIGCGVLVAGGAIGFVLWYCFFKEQKQRSKDISKDYTGNKTTSEEREAL